MPHLPQLSPGEKVLYQKSCVCSCAGWAVCTHMGHGRGYVTRDVLVQLAHAEGHDVATADLTAGSRGWTRKARILAQGNLLASFVFWLRIFLRNPRFGFRRSKRVLAHRQAIPATVTGDIQFLFSPVGGPLSQRRSGLISVHILVVMSTNWLGHTKAMSRQCNKPFCGTMICFLFFLLMFLVILVRGDHLESLFNYAV